MTTFYGAEYRYGRRVTRWEQLKAWLWDLIEVQL